MITGRRVALVTVLCLSCMVALSAGGLAADFSDVPKWQWAWCYVQGVCDAGVAGGYDDGLFRPEWLVTRDQMAVFLVRALGEAPANPEDPQSWKDAYEYDPADPSTWVVDFTDVPASGWGDEGGPHWAWFHIQRLSALGVTKGVTATEYGPSQEVRRDQMAVFLIRALGLECADPCEDASCWPYDPSNPATWAHEFEDVPATGQETCHGAHWAWFHVQALYETGVTTGVTLTTYGPGQMVRRDQMAAFICRAWSLPMPPQPYNITDYFPLDQGDTWLCTDPGGDMYTKAVSGTEEIGGQVYTCVSQSGLPHYDGYVEYLRAAPDGLRLGGFHEDWLEPVPGTVTFDPPWYLPNGLDPGDVVTQSMTVFRDGSPAGEAEFTLTFVGRASAAVHTGTFLECMRVVISQDWPGAEDDDTSSLWLAKGVGLVKEDGHELFSATVGGVRYPADGYWITDYFPLGQGDYWEYDNPDVGPLSVSGTRVVNGVNTVQFCTLDTSYSPPCVTQVEYYTSSAAGVRWHGYHQADCSGGGAEYDHSTCQPAAPMIRNGLRIGDSVTESTMLTHHDTGIQEPLAQTYTFVGLEDVTVPAGTFLGCMRIDWEQSSFGADSENELKQAWFAPGVGLVQVKALGPGGDVVGKLVSAEVSGVSYP